MKAYKVINTLRVGNNTAIIINDKCKELYNGIKILDENENNHVVLSIGMNDSIDGLKTTTLLIEGNFNSKKMLTK